MALAQPRPGTDWSREISFPEGGLMNRSGVPANPSGVPANPSGVPANPSGVPANPSNIPAGQSIIPASQPGRPASQTAVPMNQSAGTANPVYPGEFSGSTGLLDLRTHQPADVIEAPTSVNEAFLGSMRAMLLRNRGNFVVATLLIGTQGTTAWEGLLYEVGNDYFVIYQTGRQRYIACDIYALKYMEFYDTRQRELCENLLRQDGTQSAP